MTELFFWNFEYVIPLPSDLHGFWWDHISRSTDKIGGSRACYFSLLHLSHAPQPAAIWSCPPTASPKFISWRSSIILAKSSGHFLVLVLVSTALDPGLPPLCDAHVPRLPWLYSPGLLPTLPVPSQSLPQGCSLSLCCSTFLEFCPTSSSLLTPHTFPWAISCQISTSSIQISFLIFRFTNLSIGHIHFDIPQVAKLKMSRVEFVIDPEICCVLGPSEWHCRSLSYLSWAAGYNPSLSFSLIQLLFFHSVSCGILLSLSPVQVSPFPLPWYRLLFFLSWLAVATLGSLWVFFISIWSIHPAKVIFNGRTSDHTTSLLKAFQWLNVVHRIKAKLFGYSHAKFLSVLPPGIYIHCSGCLSSHR